MTSSACDVHALLRELADHIGGLRQRSVPTLRRLRRDYSRRLSNADARSVFWLAARLRDDGIVHRFFGDELIANHTAAMDQVTRRDLDVIGAGMDSWDQVDSFATIVAGPAWRAGRVVNTDVEEWARSNDRWWRRTALVCTTRLNAPGTKGDARRTLAVCRILLDDRDDTIVKAMSWALRALARRDPKSAATFIRRYRARLAPRIIREVTNKLSAGLKTPRRSSMSAN
jgi:3-methyladenine DNA glycosylase AlkD